MLKSLGVAGDTDANVTLLESLDDLVAEIVDDLYLAHFGRERDDPALAYGDALQLAREVVDDPATELRPLEPAARFAGRGLLSASRKTFCAELEIRKRRLGVLGYDDLLSRLAAALDADDSPAQVRMHQRWPIVMVDEFQDTDQVQWQVIDRAFSGRSTVILIGDPKQAIYAFRGGDIVTYLKAAKTAGEQKTLGTNWRSDAALLERLQVVLRGAATRRPRDRRGRRRGVPPRVTGSTGRAAQRPVPAAGRPTTDVGPQRYSEPTDRRTARAYRRRPGRRHPRAAGQRRDIRR